MSEEKPKKPFLKRGTRQFLSNATVRSLSQKPRIMQFSDDNLQTIGGSFTNTYNFSKNDSREDIVIAVKPKTMSREKPQSVTNGAKQTAKRTNNLADKAKQSRNQTNLQEPIHVSTNSKPSTSSSHSLSKGSQKKPTLLADYLNNNTSNETKPLVRKPPSSQSPIPVPPSKTVPVKLSPQPIYQSQAQNLKMQDIEDDEEYSDEENQYNSKNYKKPQCQNRDVEDDQDDNEFLAKKPKVSRYSPVEEPKRIVEPVKKKPNLLQEAYTNSNKKEKQNFNSLQNQKTINNADEKTTPQQNEVNFQSDSDDDQSHPKKNQFKLSKANTQNKNSVHNNRFKEENQEDEQNARGSNDGSHDDSEEINRKATVKMGGTKPQSKVTQMFNKNNKNSNNSQSPNPLPEPLKPQKMSIDDIPKQLIEQIVEKYFKDAKAKYQKKQQNLFQQVKIVQKKQQSMNEQQKALQKRAKQFQKQMDEKNKEFENKIKNQQNKITREKMYLKDQQTTGKVDWKTKNEVQELKQQLEEERNEKKRIEVKLKGELDRLKARYNEDMEVKKNLENRIREYELRDIKEKEIKVKEEKQLKQEIVQKKKSFWDDAPKQTFLQRFYAKDFSLCEYPMQNYFFQHNEFYQYYTQKGDIDTLQMQENEGNKIKRTYQNGKIEIQSSKKFVKEIFPWGFIIVHYINGDVKQIIQIKKGDSVKQMEIYFSKNSQIIEYTICDGKNIHYFLANDQIELNDQVVDLREIYTGSQNQRIVQGAPFMYQKNAKGKFVQIY